MKKYLFFVFLILLLASGCGNNKELPENTEIPVPAETPAEASPTAEATAEPVKTAEPTLVPATKTPETKAPESVPDKEVNVKSEKTGGLSGKVICIDAGHGKTEKTGKEKIAPDSEETKAKHVSGADGSVYSEEEINLMVAKKLRDKLQALGVEVIMTREGHNCDYSNIDRAEIANNAGADLMIRIHADSAESSSAKGMTMLLPSSEHISDKELIRVSRNIGEKVLDSAAEATGAKNRGCVERPDMTGFNWSEVPVILLEMGFLSNPDEDASLSEDSYQNKIVQGIVSGLQDYYG